jgi:hypothetical protein
MNHIYASPCRFCLLIFALYADVSSLSSRFSAIEETNTDVQSTLFARLRMSVFEVISQQERENPDGGNA